MIPEKKPERAYEKSRRNVESERDRERRVTVLMSGVNMEVIGHRWQQDAGQ